MPSSLRLSANSFIAGEDWSGGICNIYQMSSSHTFMKGVEQLYNMEYRNVGRESQNSLTDTLHFDGCLSGVQIYNFYTHKTPLNSLLGFFF